jgi:hypothetical protein
MMMFIWTTERFKLDLVSYECRAEGTKLIELDRTEIFTEILLHPNIVVRCELSQKEITEKRIMRALETAQKYSLVANSIKSRVVIVPDLKLMHGDLSGQS